MILYGGGLEFIMKRRLGINADCIVGGFSYSNVIKLKDVGFDSTFVSSAQAGVAKLSDISQSVGINMEFLHAPFTNINTMWEEGEAYRRIFDLMKLTVESASASNIPMVIIHLSSGWDCPAVNELGLSRFDQLVNFAKQKNVKIAFENLRNKENVLAVMERYKDNPLVGYCYDAGHEHCYTDGVDWIRIFGDKLFCTHIHDNFGYDRSTEPDAHLLPFDGSVDYADMIRRLDEIGYEGTLMLEVFNTRKPEYKEMTEDEFFKTCYDRIKKISEL